MSGAWDLIKPSPIYLKCLQFRLPTCCRNVNKFTPNFTNSKFNKPIPEGSKLNSKRDSVALIYVYLRLTFPVLFGHNILIADVNK